MVLAPSHLGSVAGCDSQLLHEHAAGGHTGLPAHLCPEDHCVAGHRIHPQQLGGSDRVPPRLQAASSVLRTAYKDDRPEGARQCQVLAKPATGRAHIVLVTDGKVVQQGRLCAWANPACIAWQGLGI